MGQSNIEKLDAKIAELKADGVVDMKLYRTNFRSSKESVAKAALDLMEAETVVDTETF
jgi:ribosomal protein L19E